MGLETAENNVSMIEGRNAVREAFRAGKTIDRLFVQDGLKDGPVMDLIRRAKKAAIPLSLLCCLLVPLGYFLYETILLTAPVAAVNVLPNALQAAIGAALGTLVGRHLQALIKRK